MSQKRQQLIDAAERIFYEEGFFATGVDSVIDRAGISRRTMYQHFKSKDDLVVAVLQQRDRTYFEYIDRKRLSIGASPQAIALKLAKSHARWLADEGRHGCLFMKALAEYSNHSRKITEVAREHKHSLHRYLSRLFADAEVTQPESAAFRLGILLEGSTQLAQVFPIKEVREALFANVRSSFEAN